MTNNDDDNGNGGGTTPRTVMRKVTPVELIDRLNQEIDDAVEQGLVNKVTVLLEDARDEISRLNVNLELAASEIERLFRWINKTRGKKIEIVHK